MDIFSILFLSVTSMLVGVILTLVAQYYALYAYFKNSPISKPQQKHSGLVDYKLPEALKKQLESETICDNANSSLPISLILQFLYHELRHSEGIKNWLYKKLTLEFDELLTKTTIGKFFESITIKDMHLGTQFPDIRNITVDEVKLDKKQGHIETINLGLNIDYSGNFLLSIDGKMKFGKTAYLSIKVKKVCGLVRLQFTRHPYTHWSFTFYTDPTVELDVESHFQGRQLQSNITSLIVNQIRKAIKRKHTLPNYKIRYKPFFVKTDPSQLELEDSDIVPQGQLVVNCIELSRLSVPCVVHSVYLTLSIDSAAWVSAYKKEDGRVYLTLEVTISHLRHSQLGAVFRQGPLQSQGGGTVIVDSVAPCGSAYRGGLRHGDTILAVENRPVSTVQQLSKAIRGASSGAPAANLVLRVERCAPGYVVKGSSSAGVSTVEQPNHGGEVEGTATLQECEDPELTQTECDSFIMIDNVKKEDPPPPPLPSSSRKPKLPRLTTTNVSTTGSSGNTSENVSKIAQTLGNFTLRKRKASMSERASTETTPRHTPASSTPATPQHSARTVATLKKLSVVTPEAPPEVTTAAGHEQTGEATQDDNDCAGSRECIEVHKGKEVLLESTINYMEEFQFQLKEKMKYLNVNVWGVTSSATGGNSTTDATTLGSGDKATERDQLLGYINVPLSHVLNECCSCVLGHYMRSYSFLPPPSSNSSSCQQTEGLMSHSGFEQVFCYGDVLLSFTWVHEEYMELKRKVSSSSCLILPDSTDGPISNLKHDFVRTQFHRTVHCDFCSKKIWLKDAVQCKQCGLCCHKKCVAKCQMSTKCLTRIDNKVLSKENSDSLQLDMVGGDALPVSVGEESLDDQNRSMKRVNSTNSLAVPGGSGGGGSQQLSPSMSQSLSPSPHRTPSRKASLAVVANPFVACVEALDEAYASPDTALDTVYRLQERVTQYSDENLMDAAKDSGQRLYLNMPHDQLVEKVNFMVTTLKKALDSVTVEHMDLSRQLSIEESESEKAKIAFLLGQADSRVHGFSALMLHYCSSLQHPHNKII